MTRCVRAAAAALCAMLLGGCLGRQATAPGDPPATAAPSPSTSFRLVALRDGETRADCASRSPLIVWRDRSLIGPIPLLDEVSSAGVTYEIGFETQGGSARNRTRVVLGSFTTGRADAAAGELVVGASDARLGSLVAVDRELLRSGALRLDHADQEAQAIVCSEDPDVAFTGSATADEAPVARILRRVSRAALAGTGADAESAVGRLLAVISSGLDPTTFAASRGIPQPLADILGTEDYVTLRVRSEPTEARILYKDKSTGRRTDARVSVRTSLLRDMSLVRDGYLPCRFASSVVEVGEGPDGDLDVLCRLTLDDEPGRQPG